MTIPKPISFTEVDGAYDGPPPEQFAVVGGMPGAGESVAWADVTGKPSTFAPAAHEHPFTEVTGTASVAQVPDLPASKVASGTLADARIPALAVAKISGLQAIIDDYETRIAALEAAAV